MNSIESDLEGALHNLNSNLSLIIDELALLKLLILERNLLLGLILS